MHEIKMCISSSILLIYYVKIEDILYITVLKIKSSARIY